MTPNSGILSIVNPGQDDNKIFICDRGDRRFRNALIQACPFDVTWKVKVASPLGGEVLVVGMDTSTLTAPPKVISVGSSTYMRVLDRFYLPRNPDPSVSIVLFDLCADLYEQIIDRKRNLATISLLLDIALAEIRSKKARVLDFGCGTGLSAEVVCMLNETGASIKLYGTDASQRMLRLASKRQIRTIPAPRWIVRSAPAFDIVISSYVLHYGITDVELSAIWHQLDMGVFVANFYQGEKSSLDALDARLRSVGFVSERRPGRDETEGTIFVCHK